MTTPPLLEIDEELDAAFTGIVRERYLATKVREFAENYPKQFACAGEENARRFEEVVLEKAESYGMHSSRNIDGLRILMRYLGCGFDLDPQYPWARFAPAPPPPLAARPPGAESSESMEKVYAAFLAFSQKTQGQDFAPLVAAYTRVMALELADLARPRTDEAVLETLRSVYPERYAALPERGWQEALLQTAGEKAAACGCAGPAGRVLFAGLMFLYGVGVDTDPLYAALELQPGQDEEQILRRVKTLVGRALRDMTGEDRGNEQ